MFRLIVAAITCLVLVAAAAKGADRFFINTSGRSWGTPGSVSPNWSATDGGAGGATAPSTSDAANFTLNNTYTVTFTNNTTNQHMIVEQGTVTLDLNGSRYSLTDFLSPPAVQVGTV